MSNLFILICLLSSQGLDWLAQDSRSGDSSVLYFNGYRTLIADNVDSVMVAEDGKEITKEEVRICISSFSEIIFQTIKSYP